MQQMWFQSLGQEDPLEKEMATHSSVLAWEIPWTKEPGGLQSMESQKSLTQLSNLTTNHFFLLGKLSLLSYRIISLEFTVLLC